MSSHYIGLGGYSSSLYSPTYKPENDQLDQHSVMMQKLAEIIDNYSKGLLPVVQNPEIANLSLEKTLAKKLPPVLHISTNIKSAPQQSNTVTQNECENIYFPGLNTPDDSYAQNSDSTKERLLHLAELLSPLRTHSSNSPLDRCGTPKQRFENSPEPFSAGSHTRSFQSSVCYPLRPRTNSARRNNSEPSPFEGVGPSVPVVSYRSSPNSPERYPMLPLRAWGKEPCSSYFELYKPMIVSYPSVWEFSDIRSPVVWVNSSTIHSTCCTVWRKVEIAAAKEIWQWGNVFEKILDHTLFKLSALSRNQQYITLQSHAVWRMHRYNLKELIKIMRSIYLQEYGTSVWATSEADVMRFLQTIDTCCSLGVEDHGEEDYQVDEDRKFEDEKSIEISMRFGANNAQVRRYMRQIVVDPSHIYAMTGEEFSIRPIIWDPHQSFAKLKTNVSFTLDPQISWLEYNPTTHTFSGMVPESLGKKLTYDSIRLTHYKLELGLVAKIKDILPMGSEKETTIKAKVNIWVQNSGQTVNSLFDSLVTKTEPVHFAASPTPSIVFSNDDLKANSPRKETFHRNEYPFGDILDASKPGFYPTDHKGKGVVQDSEFGEASFQTLNCKSPSGATNLDQKFIGAILPKYFVDQDHLEMQLSCAEDKFSSPVPREVYEEARLDSWMKNAMTAHLLQQRNDNNEATGSDLKNYATPSDLAQRNEFWDLALPYTQESDYTVFDRQPCDMYGAFEPLNSDYTVRSDQLGSNDEDNGSQCGYLSLDGVPNAYPREDDEEVAFLNPHMERFMNDGRGEGHTSSTESVQGYGSPRSSDYGDYYKAVGDMLFEPLGKCGPKFTL